MHYHKVRFDSHKMRLDFALKIVDFAYWLFYSIIVAGYICENVFGGCVMKKLSLNGAWSLDVTNTAFVSVPATVPGSVYHDLL